MIYEGLKSDKTRPISAALRNLQKLPEVNSAVLCTEDGLAVNGQAPEQLAAVASFLVASAHQGSAILGQKSDVREVAINLENGMLLICWPFLAGDISLILAVTFNREIPYKRILKQTSQAIHQAISD